MTASFYSSAHLLQPECLGADEGPDNGWDWLDKVAATPFYFERESVFLTGKEIRAFLEGTELANTAQSTAF